MNKEEFNKLEITKQIDYMNVLLNDNNTITGICKDIGIARSTLGDRFRRVNYKHDAIINQYIQSGSQALIRSNNSSITKKVIQKDINSKSKIAIIQDNNLIDEVKELLSMKDDLKLLIQNYNRDKSIIDVIEPLELKVDKALFKGELRGRLIKVYDNVNNSWQTFCKINSEYKMQDLYSMALLEYINKYKGGNK